MVLQNGSTNDIDIFQEICSANMACSANFIISSAYLRYKILIAPIDNQGETVGMPYVSEFIGKCKLLIIVVIDDLVYLYFVWGSFGGSTSLLSPVGYKYVGCHQDSAATLLSHRI